MYFYAVYILHVLSPCPLLDIRHCGVMSKIQVSDDDILLGVGLPLSLHETIQET